MIAAIAIVAEQRIREAMERGEFDDLPGKGRPLDLEEDSGVPEELRMAWKLLKNGGYLDEAKAGEMPATLQGMLGSSPDERVKLRQMQKLQVIEARFARHGGRAARIGEDEGYYSAVVDRLTVAKGEGE